MSISPMLKTSNRPHDPQSIIVKSILLLTSTLTVMAGATVSPALPAMQTAFSEVENVELLVRLVITLPALFIVIGAPLAGYIVDRFGRKKLLIVSTTVYGLAGVSGYIAPNLDVILLGRAILGLAVAGLMTSVTTLIADYFDGEQRASFLGIQAAFMGLGGTIFLTVAGILAESGWRNPFLVYGSALLLAPLIMSVLYEPERVKSSEQKNENPPSEQYPIRLMFLGYTAVVFIQVVFYLIPVQLPFLLEQLTQATASQAGLAIAGMTLFFAIASSQYGWINRRFDHLTLMMASFLITGLGYILINLATGWDLIIIALPLAGFGIGLLMPNINAWLANESPPSLRGRVLGGYATALFAGQFLSPLVAQPLNNNLSLSSVYGVFGIVTMLLGLLVLIFQSRLNRFVGV